MYKIDKSSCHSIKYFQHPKAKSLSEFVNSYFTILLVILFCSCDKKKLKIIKSGEVSFRTTYNYGRELTDREFDSLQKSKPAFMDEGVHNKFYELLSKKSL